jgi:pyruvate dehydrogenase E1 component beta subunit
MARLSYREAVNQALAEEMGRDDSVFLMGEEVGHYQGAYKVSQGLLEKFGEKRVVDTPIAECGFVGVGIGAAMVGLRPVIELMTWNFSLVAIDQIINNAAKVRYMSGGQFKVPVVFRGPGGAAHQLGAQHSQCLEYMYANVPGLKVVMPSTPADAKGLLKASIRDDDPIVFIEGELLYSVQGDVPDGEHVVPIGKGDVKREGTDATIVAWGRMVHIAMEAAEVLAKEGISVEIVDPRTIRPLDEELIFESVRKTNRAVVVEEAHGFSAVGAEIVARIQRSCFDDLDAPVERVHRLDVPMPYALNLEDLVVPTKETIVAAVKRSMYVEAA